MRRFVILDRDGTINVDTHYLSDPAQLQLIPGAGAALRRLKELGLGLIVVTNQSGVGRGLFGMDAVERVNARLAEMLAAEGVVLDGIYICPHAPDQDCTCRKPLPELVRQAAEEHGFDPGQAFMIGDKRADVELGRNVGATTFLVLTGWGRDELAKGAGASADHVVPDLPAAARIVEDILARP